MLNTHFSVSVCISTCTVRWMVVFDGASTLISSIAAETKPRLSHLLVFQLDIKTPHISRHIRESL